MNKKGHKEITELDREYMNILESILFAVGDSIEIKTLAKALKLGEKYTKSLLLKLANEYDYNMRGIKLVKTEDNYRLTTRSEYFDYIKLIMTNYNVSVLSQAALETLAIVAYKQPVTRVDLELIRGVKSTSSLDLLIDRGLVESAGKLEDVLGKPMAFKTTKEFLYLAGIKNISQLPEFDTFLAEIEAQIQETNDDNNEDNFQLIIK